jgi:hypothetical protein
LSDKSCHKDRYDKGVLLVESAKVADEFVRMMNEQNKPTGVHQLIVGMRAKPIEHVYKLFSKDAKSSDREIPVMNMDMRVFQNMSESLLDAFNEEVDNDLMLSSKKHARIAEEVKVHINAKIAPVISSQDKKFFSGYLYPEIMSICVAFVARLCGSTSMVSSAAMLRCNRSRLAVLPSRFATKNEALLAKIPDSAKVIVNVQESGGKMSQTIAIKCMQHMMQGVGAAAGAVINTSYYLGMTELQAQTLKFVKHSKTYTTSDDTVTMALMTKSVSYLEARTEVIEGAIDWLKHSMMKNSEKKQVDARSIGEFNNRITTKEGMVTVAPIYASLNCQPLLQASPMADLIQCISNARSGIFWGNPIDASQIALIHNLLAWRIKWLVTPEQMKTLYSIGMIPRDASELIEGFFPRTREAVQMCWVKLTEQQVQDVMDGTTSIASALSAMTIRGENQPKRRPLTYEGDFVLKCMVESIDASRSHNNRLNPKYIRVKSVKNRIWARNKFFELLNSSGMPESFYQVIQRVQRPQKCHIVFRAATNVTTKPTQMGMTNSVELINVSRVISERFFGFHYRTAPLPDELEKVSIDEEKFIKWYKLRLQEKSRVGTSFTSPIGLPLVRMCDGKVFRSVTCYNFYFDIPPIVHPAGVESYEGMPIQNFKPTIWGDDSLSMVPKNGVISYGSGYQDGVQYVYFCVKKRKKRFVASEGKDREIFKENKIPHFHIYYNDATPITLPNADSSVQPSLTGVYGDPVAILNYGGFIKSSHPTGFEVYRKVFEKHRSEIPFTVRSSMRAYPYFAPDAIQIKREHNFRLIDSNCIARLEFVTCSQKDGKHVNINLSGQYPVITKEPDAIKPKMTF